MKRVTIFACMILALSLLTGCPAQNSSGSSKEPSAATSSAAASASSQAASVQSTAQGKAALPVDESEISAITQYLNKTIWNFEGTLPEFMSIESLDKNWLVLKYFSDSNALLDDAALKQKYSDSELASLEKIEQAAKKYFNPGVALPATGDYSYFNGSHLDLTWRAEDKLFSWHGRGVSMNHSEVLVYGAQKKDDRYIVTAADIDLSYAEDEILPSGELGTPKGDLLSGGKKVGTFVSNQKTEKNEYTFTADKNSLPHLTYVLQSNGQGGYYILSKTGGSIIVD